MGFNSALVLFVDIDRGLGGLSVLEALFGGHRGGVGKGCVGAC